MSTKIRRVRASALPSNPRPDTLYEVAGELYLGGTKVSGLAGGSGSVAVQSVTSYDASNRVATYIDTAGVTWTRAYNAAGNVSTETGSNGRVRTYTYDASNRFLSMTEV